MARGAAQSKLDRIESYGWFVTSKKPGDRTLEQQLTGLDRLLAGVDGKTVLDVGCAEGLIGIECAKRGASYVFGVDLLERHIGAACEFAAEVENCAFEVADANEWEPGREFDVVLLLAVLHKLRDPSDACRRLAAAARELCVVRIGLTGNEQIIDPRSNNVPHDIGRVMRSLGFRLRQVEPGPLGEETLYYVRVSNGPR